MNKKEMEFLYDLEGMKKVRAYSLFLLCFFSLVVLFDAPMQLFLTTAIVTGSMLVLSFLHSKDFKKKWGLK